MKAKRISSELWKNEMKMRYLLKNFGPNQSLKG